MLRDTRLKGSIAALVCAPPTAFALLSVFVFTMEWYRVGVEANPAVIADYHFGSEAMLNRGGSAYAAPEAYASSCLLGLAAGIPILGLFAVAWWRRSLSLTVSAYAAAIAFLVLRGIQ